jgi:hypothetical protein
MNPLLLSLQLLKKLLVFKMSQFIKMIRYTFAGIKSKKMRKLILSASLIVAMVAIQSCGEAEMDQSAVDAKINEQAAAKIEEATATMNAQCETRMATEVKALSDSIINATQMANAAQ